MEHHLVDLYQVLPNYFPGAKKWPTAGDILAYIKSTFLEYGHVAYQIKGIEAHDNMLNCLPLHTPLIPWWGKKVNCFSFLEVVMLHVKLTGIKQRTQCTYNTPTSPRSGYIKGKQVKSIRQV